MPRPYDAPDIDGRLLSPYDPKATEEKIYKAWEESGYFNPDNLPDQPRQGKRTEVFSVVLPPPNVTGVLHIGHAYEDTLQDILVRYARMRGKKALWVPGTDSAAIATQARVEKDIQKNEGKSRHDLGREELVKRVKDFAQEHEHIILNQIRKVGASLDWSRYAYTLDEKRYKAVMTAFKNMYDAGLIERGNRIVNWDTKGQTTISDDEVTHEERAAKLYTFRYSKDFPIPVATTRLETKVGDTAVAVHPDDPRYKQYVGKEYEAIFCDVPIKIKIVADGAVEMEFGTGALGVTPAHSMTDWEIADRHNISYRPQVINEYAKMMVEGRLNGKKVEEARVIVAEWLKEEGLLEKEEDIKQNVSLSERTGAVVEPLPKIQWWIRVNKPFKIPHSEIPGIEAGSEITLKELMKKAVDSGGISMPQEGFRKAYFHWIDNLRDWCISRQIWFGHRIPVWYKGDEIYCAVTPPSGNDWIQEEDVLDTWFSSALWTFSTLGWPEKTFDLKAFHPTSFMSPAYEILFLWVSRMILMSGFHLGQVPFRTALIHGLVRDKQGRKFSKSLGNGVDPLSIIEKYGADALRMGLVVGTAIGNDVSFDENKVKGYKLFANKLWNITRFIEESVYGAQTASARIEENDQALIAELDALAEDITTDLENYRVYMAAEKLYHYAWHRLADVILEESKTIFRGENASAKLSRQATLSLLLDKTLRLLHPFMPFITEELWSIIKKHDISTHKELLMVAEWPIHP